MKDIRPGLRGLTRTIAVFLGGVVLSIAVSALLGHVLLPNNTRLIVKALTTPPSNPQWEEISRQLHRSGLISVYLIDPLVGLVVGVFVGLLQKSRVIIVAASCLVPDFLEGFSGDRAKVWATSTSGILRYLLHHSLPFITAMIAAALCHYLISRKRNGEGGLAHLSLINHN